MTGIKLLSGVMCSLIFMVHPISGFAAEKISGKILIDGSSTVFPITEAIAEEFQKINPKVRVAVGVSGTGGGFKKFTAGETDINDASRVIQEKEIKMAQGKGITYVELPVAYDGITVAVNNGAKFITDLSMQELKQIWKPESGVKKWNQIREEFPDQELKLYGPGPDSGTFDYFTEAVNGKSHSCR